MPNRILVISANSFDTKYLEFITKERNEIHSQLDFFIKEKRLEHRELSDVPLKRITDVISDFKPDFIHYSGHSNKSHVYLSDENRKKVAFEEILEVFSKAKFVFLNSCYSEHAAKQLINSGVKAVIGTTKVVVDETAKEVSKFFYCYLSRKDSVYDAFKEIEKEAYKQLKEAKFRFSTGYREYKGDGKGFPWRIYEKNGASRDLYLIPKYEPVLASAPENSDRLFFIYHDDQKKDFELIKDRLLKEAEPETMYINSFCNLMEWPCNIKEVLAEIKQASLICLLVNGESFHEVWDLVVHEFQQDSPIGEKKLLSVKFEEGSDEVFKKLEENRLSIHYNRFPDSNTTVSALKELDGNHAMDHLAEFIFDSIQEIKDDIILYETVLEKNRRTLSPVLDLGNCGLTYFPAQILAHTWLEKLILGTEYFDLETNRKVKSENHGGKNRIAVIPEEIRELFNLEHLILKGNKITDFQNIAQLPLLQTLYLDDNQISDLTDFPVFPRLQRLSLDENQISDLSSLKKLPLLQILSANKNRIIDLSCVPFLPLLKHLHLFENQIAELAGLPNLPRLMFLSLGGNNIKTFLGMPSLPLLKQLALYDNQISDLTDFPSFPLLDTLYLNENRINNLAGITNIPNRLVNFSLGGNKITNLEGFPKLPFLQKLYLNDNQIQDLAGMPVLPSLKLLYLNDNYLNDLGYLPNHPLLEELFLNFNRITTLASMPCLPKVIQLNLDENKIIDLTGMPIMPQLQHLNLEGNQIRNLKGLPSLPQIQHLYLNKNKIDLAYLPYLPQLQNLNLESNNIKNLKGFPRFPQLQLLNLDSNQIVDLKGLSSLPQLQCLNLNSNKINNLRSMPSLELLQHLYLSKNKIQDLLALPEFPRLQHLALEENQLKDEEQLELLLLKFYTLDTLKIAKNQFENLSKVITESEGNASDLKNFLQALKCDSVPNNKAKIILIGNGCVGKTCIRNQLLGRKFNPNEISTHAIQIDQWLVDGLDLSIWDFGGQDIYHATHQHFMSQNAVYVLVWDWESENSQNHTDSNGLEFQNHPINYWLDYWKALGKSSPLLIVRNKGELKKHQSEMLENKGELMEIYNLKEEHFITVSAKTGNNIVKLQEEILNRIKNLPEIRKLIPKIYSEVRQQLEELSKRTFVYQNYLSLCQELGLKSSLPQSILRFLHQTGVCYYKKGVFGNKIILDQTWIIKAIYALFDREENYSNGRKKAGRFTTDELLNCWENTYTEDEKYLFISFMESCEIIIKAKKNLGIDYIVPRLLPSDFTIPKKVKKLIKNGFHYRYKYSLLHQGILNRFLVRAASEAHIKSIWRKGIWLSDNGTDLLVEGDIRNKTIRIRIWGTSPSIMLDVIEKTFMEINDEYAPLEFVSTNGKDWSQ